MTLPSLGGPLQMTCPGCAAAHLLWSFPALVAKPLQAQTAERVMVQGEASCFFHPTKKAMLPCEQCGRFLCTLCDLEFGGKHFCPACLDSKQGIGKGQELETSRTVYDQAALLVAVVPIFIWFVTVLTAPVAIYYAIRAFRSPGSLVRRSNWRAVVALIIAVLQLSVWVLLLSGVFKV